MLPPAEVCMKGLQQIRGYFASIGKWSESSLEEKCEDNCEAAAGTAGENTTAVQDTTVTKCMMKPCWMMVNVTGAVNLIATNKCFNDRTPYKYDERMWSSF